LLTHILVWGDDIVHTPHSFRDFWHRILVECTSRSPGAAHLVGVGSGGGAGLGPGDGGGGGAEFPMAVTEKSSKYTGAYSNEPIATLPPSASGSTSGTSLATKWPLRVTDASFPTAISSTFVQATPSAPVPTVSAQVFSSGAQNRQTCVATCAYKCTIISFTFTILVALRQQHLAQRTDLLSGLGTGSRGLRQQCSSAESTRWRRPG
jgi:hypothetical protein